MGSFYLTISTRDEDNIKKGFQIAKKIMKAGLDLTHFHHEEVTLTDTGWASNTLVLHTAADDKDAVKDLTDDLHEQFEKILCASYEVESVDDIEFDDEDFEEQIAELISYLQGKYDDSQFHFPAGGEPQE